MRNNTHQILSIALNEGKTEGLKVIEMTFEAFRVIEVKKECIEDYFKMPESKYKGIVLLVHDAIDSEKVEVLFNEDFKPSNQDDINWDYAVIITLLNNNINKNQLNSLLGSISYIISLSKYSFKKNHPPISYNQNTESQVFRMFMSISFVFRTLRYPFWIEKPVCNASKKIQTTQALQSSKTSSNEQLEKQKKQQNSNPNADNIDGLIARVIKTGRMIDSNNSDNKNLLSEISDTVDTNTVLEDGSSNNTNPFERMVFSYEHANQGVSVKAKYNLRDNTMTVLKGSLFSIRLSPRSSASLVSVRDTMIENKELIKKGDSLELQYNHTFRDSDQAINTVTGGALVFGRCLWKNEAGVSLDLILNNYGLKNPNKKQYKDDDVANCMQSNDKENLDTNKDNHEQKLVDGNDKLKTDEKQLGDRVSEDKTQEDTPDIRDIVFACEYSEKNVSAKAKYNPKTNRMVVLKGSKFAKEYDGLNDTYKEYIQKLLEEGSLQEEDGFFELLVDHEFNSPSMACGIALGSHARAMEVWESKYGTFGEVKDKLKKDFSCKHEGKKVLATATYQPSTRRLLVHKGSRFSQYMTPSKIGGEAYLEKKKMIEDGFLVLKNDCYVLTKDYWFSHVSRASEIVTGASGGRKIWINYFGEDIAEAHHSLYSYY